MDNEQITLIKKNLMKKLTPSRYEHTLGVAYTSAALSMRYGYDMDKAFMAGLLRKVSFRRTSFRKMCQVRS